MAPNIPDAAPHPARIAEDALPRVTVIVPAWNTADVIAECLSALVAQEYPASRYEICVVDNGSTDATREIVSRFPGVRLLHEASPGSYAARNAGLSAATGDYVAFTDADCTPSAGWLRAGVAVATSRPDAGIVAGRIELYRLAGASETAAAYERVFAFDQADRAAAGYCVTANWLSPTALLRSLGGFDAGLRSGGDFAMSRRIAATGARVAYAPDMLVRHPARTSVAALLAKRRRTSAGFWQMHPGARARLRMLAAAPLQMARDIRAISRAPQLTAAMRLRLAWTVVRLSATQFHQIARMILGSAAPRS